MTPNCTYSPVRQVLCQYAEIFRYWDEQNHLQVIVDQEQQLSYCLSDADWTVFDTTALSGNLTGTFRFDRGFTGHEHYTDLNIINMNGRLYDPVIARFFSPDNFVQAPDFTQSYNRYSYCLNNPLQYVDPSGESFIAAAFAIGALTNVFFQMITGNINSAGDFLFSAGIGGLAGMAGAAAGSAAASAVGIGGFLGGAASGAASGAVAGSITSFGNTFMSSHNLGTSIGYGVLGGIMGALSGGLMGGLSRGILDARHGYDFLDGSFYEEFEIGDVGDKGNYKKHAAVYDNSHLADSNDKYLKERIYNTYGVKEGDFNINVITTRAKHYGLTDLGWYINTRKGYIVAGYVYNNTAIMGVEYHISPYVTSSSDIIFQAYAGHELIHAYHRYILGLSYQNFFSEIVAYKYSYSIFMGANMFEDANRTFIIATSTNQWGYYYPLSYKIPSPFLFY